MEQGLEKRGLVELSKVENNYTKYHNMEQESPL